MKRKSEFGKLKWLDLVNSLYHAFVAVVFIAINVFFGNIQPTMQDYKMLIGTFLTAFFMSLFKTSATNSSGEVFKKEN
jgi:hypothetical protein